jgi:hypothetical protein
MFRWRKMISVGFMVVMLLGMFEGVFFAAGKLLQQKWAMWRVPAPVTTRHLTYAQYREVRDPVLGWPYAKQYRPDLDVNGAQRNPYFPTAAKQGSCVSLYGDSFTEGGDASSPIKNWGNVLSHLSSCYVANFGTGAYGTDQAYLRFEANRDDASPVVILGFHTDDVLRNLTRNRDLLVYLQWYGLKPRFVLDARGRLRLVPIPDLTEEEYLRATGIAGDLLRLKDENFQPGGPAGVVKLEFPFTVSVTKNMLRFYGFRSKLAHQPEWMSFLAPGHPLHALEIVVGISHKFTEVAHQRAKTPVVIVLPHSLDFAYFQNHGAWPYQTVLDGYAQDSIPYIDFGPYLLASANKRGKTYKEYFGASLHYNDEGNALVAQFVHEWLVAHGLVPVARSSTGLVP